MSKHLEVNTPEYYIEACKVDDVDTVKKADLNATGWEAFKSFNAGEGRNYGNFYMRYYTGNAGEVLLFVASKYNSINVIKYLYNEGMDLTEESLLNVATEFDSADVVRFLLSSGVELEEEIFTGSHVIYTAIDSESTNVIPILISEYGKKYDFAYRDGRIEKDCNHLTDWLSYAAAHNSIKSIPVIMNAGAKNVKGAVAEAFNSAVENNNCDCMRQLAKYGLTQAEKNAAIKFALSVEREYHEEDNIEALKLLLELGAKPTEEDVNKAQSNEARKLLRQAMRK